MGSISSLPAGDYGDGAAGDASSSEVRGLGTMVIRTLFQAPERCRALVRDSALVQALGRAFRWQKFLETGVYGTIDEIAATEKANDS